MRARSVFLLLAVLAGAASADSAPIIVQVSPQGAVSDARPVLRAAFQDDLGVDPDRTRFLIDGVEVPLSASGATEARAQPPGALAEGPHTAFVEIRDRTGHVVNRTWRFVVQLAPEADPAPRIHRVSLEPGFYVAVAPVRVAYEGGSLAATLDGAPLVPLHSGSEARLDLGNLTEGAHALTIVVEGDGGARDERTVEFRIDTTPPVVAFVDVLDLPLRATVSWSEDTGVRPETGRVLVDSKPLLDADLGPDGGRFDLPKWLASGPHVLRAEITDLAGNVGFAEVPFRVDPKPAPRRSVLSDVLGEDGLGPGEAAAIVVLAAALAGLVIVARPRR